MINPPQDNLPPTKSKKPRKYRSLLIITLLIIFSVIVSLSVYLVRQKSSDKSLQTLDTYNYMSEYSFDSVSKSLIYSSGSSVRILRLPSSMDESLKIPCPGYNYLVPGKYLFFVECKKMYDFKTQELKNIKIYQIDYQDKMDSVTRADLFENFKSLARAADNIHYLTSYYFNVYLLEEDGEYSVFEIYDESGEYKSGLKFNATNTMINLNDYGLAYGYIKSPWKDTVLVNGPDEQALSITHDTPNCFMECSGITEVTYQSSTVNKKLKTNKLGELKGIVKVDKETVVLLGSSSIQQFTFPL